MNQWVCSYVARLILVPWLSANRWEAKPSSKFCGLCESFHGQPYLAASPFISRCSCLHGLMSPSLATSYYPNYHLVVKSRISKELIHGLGNQEVEVKCSFWRRSWGRMVREVSLCYYPLVRESGGSTNSLLRTAFWLAHAGEHSVPRRAKNDEASHLGRTGQWTTKC